MNLKACGLALLSGLLLIAIFPSFSLGSLAWVALVPLLWALRFAPPLAAFWLGGITGLTAYGGIFYWVTVAMVNYGRLPYGLALPILLLLAGYLGLYVATFAWIIAVLGRRGASLQTAMAPPLWTALEWVRTYALTGFPWASLGYSQFQNLGVIQVADWAGVYGVGFLIVLVNATLVQLLASWVDRPRGRVARQPRWRLQGAAPLALVTVVLVVANLVYGRVQLRRYGGGGQSGAPTLSVALIQGNWEQDKKWDRAYQEEVFSSYRRLTLEAAARRPGLIVWPEAATPFYFQADPFYRARTLELARESGTHLLFGTPAFEARGKQMRMFNRALLLSPGGEVVRFYDKIHLVPFGEYVPLQRLLPFVNRMVEGIGDFASGREYTVMRIPEGRFSVLICFEVIFPDLVRRFVKAGAGLLVNLTNDGWFGRSAGPYQHAAMVVFRAVENRVPVVRAANTGISGFIDASGRMGQRAELFVRTQLSGSVQLAPGPRTFYTRYGDLFAYLCLLLCVVIWGAARWPRP